MYLLLTYFNEVAMSNISVGTQYSVTQFTLYFQENYMSIYLLI